MKQRVLVFGGTSEGRELVEWLSGHGGFDVCVCTATEYGAELVSGLPSVRVHEGRLDEDAMAAFIQSGSAGTGPSDPLFYLKKKNQTKNATTRSVATTRMM